MRKAKRYSLHNALFWGFLLCVGIILVFFTATLLPRMSQNLEDNAIERARETVWQSAHSVEIYLESLIDDMHFACSLIPNDLAGDDRWQEQLQLVQRGNADIVELAFISDSGECLYDTAGGVHLDPGDIMRQPWFINASTWDGNITYFSKPHVQNLFRAHRSYVITLTRAVEYVADGARHTGIMLVDIDYASFSAILDNGTIGESGYVYMVDEYGSLITHPNLELIYAGLASENIEPVEEQVVGITWDETGEEKRLLIIAIVSPTRWRMVGSIYMDEIFAMQSVFRNSFTFALLSAGFLGMAAITALAYMVTRPMKTLENSINRVEAGDLNIMIPVEGFWEVQAVSTAFNHMLSRIRTLRDQVVEEQEKKRMHELNALQAQINPHFLYNTLDSIIWMEERGRRREAIIMVSALAKLFRISINKGRSLILVSEELEHLRNYIIIQKMRFKDRFECSIEAQPEVEKELMLKLIVQPIVENAINHAIDEFSDVPLNISVRAKIDGEQLIIEVEDDGIGIPEKHLETLLTSFPGTSGIGLKNVHERIRLTYGEPFGLEIESEEDVGTKIRIRLPRMGDTE